LKKIWKVTNFGAKMAIDEKYIGGIFYTIITNLETRKIAAVLKTVKGAEIKSCLYSLPRDVRWGVEVLTRDLAGVFEDVGSEIFINAQHIADKFHILRMAFESIQSVRIRHRQEALTAERERVEVHRETELQRRDEAQKNSVNFIQKKIPRSPLLSNGETRLQLLARSRYLLFKFDSEWSEEQKARSKVLFEEYPDLKKSHEIVKKFRSFYNLSHQQNIPKAKESLYKWMNFVGAVEIPEIQNFASSVFRHKTEILNYFENGYTNAIAESINNRIQRFLINNHGTRDPDFLFFRLKKILA